MGEPPLEIVAYSSRRFVPFRLKQNTLYLCILFLGHLAAARSCLVRASRPEFAVGKDGLRRRVGRGELHYEWDEVSYCRWSHYEHGVLNIQVKGNPAWFKVSWPPTRDFYRVPEPYRSGVEKAIQAMGKWSEGEKDPAPILAASGVNKTMGIEPDTIDELDMTPKPMVAIPRPRWKIVANFLWLLLLFVIAAMMVWAYLHGDHVEALRVRTVERWFVLIISSIFAIGSPFALLNWARHPEFAVGKDGIRLPIERRPAWSSPWSLRDLGLYAWQEVSYCRWPRHVPGLLQIQVMGTQSLLKWEQPPTRLTYHVSEPYRPAVEKAIRAMGKWAD